MTKARLTKKVAAVVNVKDTMLKRKVPACHRLRKLPLHKSAQEWKPLENMKMNGLALLSSPTQRCFQC